MFRCLRLYVRSPAARVFLHRTARKPSRNSDTKQGRQRARVPKIGQAPEGMAFASSIKPVWLRLKRAEVAKQELAVGEYRAGRGGSQALGRGPSGFAHWRPQIPVLYTPNGALV